MLLSATFCYFLLFWGRQPHHDSHFFCASHSATPKIGVIQGGTDNPRENHGELLWVILRFVEHLRENHGESVLVITPKIVLFFPYSTPYLPLQEIRGGEEEGGDFNTMLLRATRVTLIKRDPRGLSIGFRLRSWMTRRTMQRFLWRPSQDTVCKKSPPSKSNLKKAKASPPLLRYTRNLIQSNAPFLSNPTSTKLSSTIKQSTKHFQNIQKKHFQTPLLRYTVHERDLYFKSIFLCLLLAKGERIHFRV